MPKNIGEIISLESRKCLWKSTSLSLDLLLVFNSSNIIQKVRHMFRLKNERDAIWQHLRFLVFPPSNFDELMKVLHITSETCTILNNLKEEKQKGKLLGLRSRISEIGNDQLKLFCCMSWCLISNHIFNLNRFLDWTPLDRMRRLCKISTKNTTSFIHRLQRTDCNYCIRSFDKWITVDKELLLPFQQTMKYLIRFNRISVSSTSPFISSTIWDSVVLWNIFLSFIFNFSLWRAWIKLRDTLEKGFYLIWKVL